jgi:tetratricopeptide (TPR) repeat protein
MRRFFVLILLVLTAVSVSAQTKSPNLQEAEKTSVEAVKLFAQKKFDEALPLAQKSVALYEQELGASDLQTARARRNLGFIELARGNKGAAAGAFDAAFEAFEKNANLDKKDSLMLAEMLQYLGALKFALNKPEASERALERALALREKFNGTNAAETINAALLLANIKRFAGKYKEIVELYRPIYENRLQSLGANNIETQDIFERYKCALLKAGREKQAAELNEKFTALKNDKPQSSGQEFKEGIVNARALNLVKPPFTSEARSARFSGVISVTVTIDENGDVIHACAMSKNAPLAQIEATEAAAWQSKFKPTVIEGKPVKVTGVIVYNFQL